MIRGEESAATMNEIVKRLFDESDAEYRQFLSKLMPTVEKERIIGVRSPYVKRIAKDCIRSQTAEFFTETLPHYYYEENNLHGYIISECKDFKKALDMTNTFLPYVDNWATCDLLSPKIFARDKKELYTEILSWISSNHTYTVRFGIKMLMAHFLNDTFSLSHLNLVSSIQNDEYYVKMMKAWYFATALAKQWDKTVAFIEEGHLEKWENNKAIQKALESLRITEERKIYLRNLKIK